MPPAIPPVLIIDHIWALASAARDAARSAWACLAAVLSKGIVATVMASPRVWSRPTALPTRLWIWDWLIDPATLLSMTTETVRRWRSPGGATVVVVVLSTALLFVVEPLS